MIKKLIIGLAIVLPMVSFASGNAFAAESNDYSVELNNVTIQASAFEQEGTLYLPVRTVSEAVGYPVVWSAAEHTVTIQKPNENIVIDMGTYSVKQGDHPFYVMNQIINGKLYMEKDFFNDCLGLSVMANPLNKLISIESVDENDITIKSISEKTEDTKLDVTLQYPQISGLADQAVADKINALLKQEAEAAKQEGQNYIKDYDDPSGNKHEVFFDYRIKYNHNDMLSLILLDYQYTGGAHGTTIQKSYTFNLKTGMEYGLRDLFVKDMDYAGEFDKLIKKEIKARELFELTPFISIADEQPYYLDNSGVTVYFQQYEYFPYAAGIQAFTADYDTIKEFINGNFSYLYEQRTMLNDSSLNTLMKGDMSMVTLKGNPTTGYSWEYTIEDESVIKLESESSVTDNNAIGAGSTFKWSFRALKAGETKITFKYYRPWEGTANAETTIEYLIKVN